MELLFALMCIVCVASGKSPTFTVDYNNATFLKDGEAFRFIAGSTHYYRTHPFYWKDRLMKMRAAGLNAVQTYIPWNIHEPRPGEYHWEDFTDLESFIKMAQEQDLFVLLRVGPYICAEWEFGGFPAWLFTKNPDMLLRTSDPTFIEEVDKWFDVLLPKVKPYLYQNGGPIIMVQIENEYGSYYACDKNYTGFLYDKCRAHLGDDIIIYTTDGGDPYFLKCVQPGPYTTIDFGSTKHPGKYFNYQRQFEPNGPAVNSEYYVGWLDNWGLPHSIVDTKNISDGLDAMLEYGANVNLFMFEGGSNFGYWNGANAPPYDPIPTSYDYDSPLNETGDITDKYLAIRKVISKYDQVPDIPIERHIPKYAYDDTNMKFMTTIQGSLKTTSPGGPINSTYPLTMEQIEFYYGFVLYRHILREDISDPTVLFTNGTRDRGYVMVDEVPMGIFYRDFVGQVEITGHAGQYLDILVENTGRIGYGNLMDYNLKGLTENVTLDDVILEDWEIYPISLENINSTFEQSREHRPGPKMSADGTLQTPSIYMGKISVPDTPDMPMDSFLDPRPWHKGQALVNGFNIGRYWPVMGPQVTLYIPKPVLVAPIGACSLVMLELENTECPPQEECPITFTDKPYIDKLPAGYSTTTRSHISTLVSTTESSVNLAAVTVNSISITVLVLWISAVSFVS